jgi:hypothetical protein
MYRCPKSLSILLSVSILATGCGTIAEKTNTLSDEKIISETSGALGFKPAEVTLVSRRTEGVNTYANIKAKNGQEFTCIINGGNILTFGMTNPPLCSKKGEPLKTSPFPFMK